jgi:hypothetical protein
MNSKKNVWQDILDRMKRKEDLKNEIASRSKNIEEFALKMITDMEDMIASTANTSLLKTLIPMYALSFESRVQTVDPFAKVEVQWLDDSNGVPRISGILIKWSKEYQEESGCEAQYFVDTAALLFRSN